MRELHFSSVVLFPGIGATQRLVTRDSPSAGAMNSLAVDSIFEYRGRFCINGAFYVPETAGALLCWKY